MVKLKIFSKDDSGAVSVDYVVLCAAIVLTGSTVSCTMEAGLSSKATSITGNISQGA